MSVWMLEKDPVVVEIRPEIMRPHPTNTTIGVNREGFAVCHHCCWGWGGASLHGYFLCPPLATTISKAQKRQGRRYQER